MLLRSRQRKKWTGLILVFLIWLFSLSTPFQVFASLPDELRLFSGQVKKINLSVPVNLQITVEDPDIVRVNGAAKQTSRIKLDHPIALQSDEIGSTEMKWKLFGAIPLKTMRVHVMPDLKVVPGGQTIGVKIKSAGILVVGHHLVPASDGKKVSPGEQAGIRMGDLIMKMNGVRPELSKVAEQVDTAGKKHKPIHLALLRDGKTINVKLTPAYDAETQTYRLGLYIRDSAAGVGTLTFYSPEHGKYGALGHVISDMDTQTPIVVGQGEIVNSSVSSISKSHSGEPGEKRAHFFKENQVLGNIEKNTRFGIFGRMHTPPDHLDLNRAIPVALAEDVHEGPAQILTVVNNQKVEKFDIEITHVSRQAVPATKGLVIRVTDPELLEKTGGIVQGMSGSPIIQDGKLVGAVTHVFVNDPTSGYGCFIEWMLQDSGIFMRSDATAGELEAG